MNPADLSASAARRLIAQRKLSPVELATACIDRVAAVNPAVNALVAADFERTLCEERTAEAQVMTGDPLGALHGLPFAVKDIIDVTGLPTTFGSEIFRENIASKDDSIVAAMRAAGGVVLGKTNNPEWSAGGNTRNAVYGITANPHDQTRSVKTASPGQQGHGGK
jgi:Asp-tRNA(Asn)/Glu-tRNA(Gln) amidotransferase A subunit family amidase